MNEPYDEAGLWNKARLFLNHAMDGGEPRTFEERALWASLALELLAKAALSRHSPLLIASPDENGKDLLIASGLLPGSGQFKSVTASTLYKRCSMVFRPFSLEEATKITRARNEYLHGSAAAFGPLPEEAWWPRFWAQAAILVSAQDKEIEELLGQDRVEIVEGFLAKNRKNIEHRVEALIERAKQRLSLHLSGGMSSRMAAEWARTTDLRVWLTHSTDATCPACGAQGTLEGENVESSEMHTERIAVDDYDAWVELTVSSDYFSCPTCHLVLDYEELTEAGLSTEFSAEGDLSDYDEPDYGND